MLSQLKFVLWWVFSLYAQDIYKIEEVRGLTIRCLSQLHSSKTECDRNVTTVCGVVAITCSRRTTFVFWSRVVFIEKEIACFRWRTMNLGQTANKPQALAFMQPPRSSPVGHIASTLLLASWRAGLSPFLSPLRRRRNHAFGVVLVRSDCYDIARNII